MIEIIVVSIMTALVLVALGMELQKILDGRKRRTKIKQENFLKRKRRTHYV